MDFADVRMGFGMCIGQEVIAIEKLIPAPACRPVGQESDSDDGTGESLAPVAEKDSRIRGSDECSHENPRGNKKTWIFGQKGLQAGGESSLRRNLLVFDVMSRMENGGFLFGPAEKEAF